MNPCGLLTIIVIFTIYHAKFVSILLYDLKYIFNFLNKLRKYSLKILR